MVNYLQTAHNAGVQDDKIKSAGFLALDLSEDGTLPGRQKAHPAPGTFNVVVHGRRPYNVDDPSIKSQDRNQYPFWNGREKGSEILTTEQVATQIQRALDEQKVDPSVPIFLDACNSGTDLNGVVPARDLAEKLNRPVVAPVDSRVFQSMRGPVLQKPGAYWATFYPDGHQETLWRPATPSGWKHMPK